MRSALLVLAFVAVTGCTKGEEGPAADALVGDGVAEVDATAEAFDPTTLDPGTVVFAASSGGGFLMSGQEEFFVGQRHGRFGLWVYGDRRAILLREDTLQTLGYRVYRQGTVSEAAFLDLLDRAANLGVAGDHRYSACNATDGGSEGVAVSLPGLAVTAVSYMGFEPCEGDPGATADEGKPPAALAAFAAALFDAEVLEPVVLVPDRIVLAGHVSEEANPPSYGCDPATSAPWSVTGVTLPEGEPLQLWTLPLDGQPARDARAFVREHLADDIESAYGGACVKQGDAIYRVYYDDVPDGEADWPF